VYCDWFNLKKRPFDKTPDPDAMYFSPSHDEALARLQQAAEERDIAVLAGEVGAGKTTLIRAFLDSLQEEFVPVVLIHPTLSSSQIVRQIVQRLGVSAPSHRSSDLMQQLYDKIFEMYEAGQTLVLIVDEAHLLKMPEGFEQLRLLTNFQLDDRNLMSLILVGQPELKDHFEDIRLRPFRQRVGYFAYLPSLSEQDVAAYLDRRWSIAGGNSDQLEHGISEKVFEYSHGVPRVINQIMHNACLNAYGDDSEIVRILDVDAAAKDLWL
jgi:general secretion pathway protein A